MAQKVFYAWQADRNQNVCHYFIRDALKQAIKKIAADAKLQESDRPELDHDRKDVSGTPRIAETIEKKIRKAAVFVADMTPISDYSTDDGRKKQTPNANVMLELGMAFRSVKSERIILVMNTAYGKPEDLPFDLKDRSHPILYELSSRDDLSYKEKLKELSIKLIEPVRMCLNYANSKVQTLPAVDLEAAQTDLNIARDSFEEALLRENFYGIKGKRFFWAITIKPANPTKRKVSFDHRLLNQAGGYLRPIGFEGAGLYVPKMKSLAMLDEVSDGREAIHAATEISLDGIIKAGRHWLLSEPADNETINFQMDHYEPVFISSTLRYCDLLRSMGIDGPYLVGWSILRCQNTNLLPNSNNPFVKARRETEKYIKADIVTVPTDFEKTGTVFANSMRPAIDDVWRGYGFRKALSFNDEGRYIFKPS